MKHEGRLTLKATAKQIRVFLDTELDKLEHVRGNELEALPFHHTFIAHFGYELPARAHTGTGLDYARGVRWILWDGNRWVHMGRRDEQEYVCGILSLTESKRKKETELYILCEYTAYLPYWVWLWNALTRRFKRIQTANANIQVLPPITDPTDIAIYNIIKAHDFDIKDREIEGQLAKYEIVLSREKVNYRRNKLRAMGYRVR